MGGLGTEPQEHGQQGPPARRTTHSLPFPFPGASFPLDSDLCPSQPPGALPVPQDPYVFLPEGTISLSGTTPSLSGTSPAPHLLPWFCPFSSAAILSWKIATQLPHLRRRAPREQKAMTWLPPQGGWEVRSPRRQNKGLAERILRGVADTLCLTLCCQHHTWGGGGGPRHFPAPGQAEKGVRGGSREGQRGHVQRNREGGSGTREEQLQPSRERWEQRRGTGSKGARKTRDGKAEGAERRETNPRRFLERLKGEGKMRFKGPRSSTPGERPETRGR